MPGTLKIFFFGDFVRQEKYYGVKDKITIQEKWKKLYGKGFDKLEVVDEPEVFIRSRYS